MKLSNVLVRGIQKRNCTPESLNINLDPFQTRPDNEIYNVACTTLVQESMQVIILSANWSRIMTKITKNGMSLDMAEAFEEASSSVTEKTLSIKPK
jgi:hypothetical protein